MILIVIVIAIGAALTLTGMPVLVVLELLAGAGLIGTHLARRAPLAPAAL